MVDVLQKHTTSLAIVDYLIQKPWAEKVLGLDSEVARMYLEVSYLDPDGQPFARNENFYTNIRKTIVAQIADAKAGITPQSEQYKLYATLPPNLEELVRILQNKKKVPKETYDIVGNLLRQYWEIQRQEILFQETLTDTKEIEVSIEQQLTPLLTSNVDFAAQVDLNRSLPKKIIESYCSKLIANKTAEPKVLLEEAVSEELEKTLPFAEAKSLAQHTAQPIPEDNYKSLSEDLRYINDTQVVSRRYKELLIDIARKAPVNGNQQFEIIHEIARQRVNLFANELIPILKNAGFSDREIEDRLPRFIDNILFSTAESPFVSKLIYSSKGFDDLLRTTIENAVKTHFNPQGISSYIPVLNKVIAAEEKKRFDEIIDAALHVLKKQPALPVILKSAAYNTYSANKNSLEGGDPIGRIPFVIKTELLGAESPEKLNKMVLSLKNQYIDISPSQKAALSYLQQQITKFHLEHPRLVRITSLYYRHTLAYGVAKVSVSTLIWHPDYALYVPVYWFNVAKSIYWESRWKPKLISKIINKVPVVGTVLGIWYKPTEWGFYENPIDRLKRNAQHFVLKKGVSLLGHASIKIGSIFNNNKIKAFGAQLLTGEIVGKLAGLWSIGGAIMTKVLKYVGIGIGAIFIWAVSYGIPGLMGFGASFGVGIAAGIKVGLAASAIGGPIVGVIAGAITTLIVTFIGTGISTWFISHNLMPPSIGALGKSIASGLGNLATSVGHGIITIAGQTAIVICTSLAAVCGISLVYTSYLESAFNPYRNTTQSTIIPTEPKLNEKFQEAAQNACIPVAALKAISQIEAEGIWSLSEQEIETFSQDGWWNSADQGALERGYCVDTCQKPGNDCAMISRPINRYCDPTDLTCEETTVYGVMQFEELTWASHLSCNHITGDGFDPNCLMKRCNLLTSVTEAAKKIKAGAGAGSSCTNWDENTMKQAAKAYCGSCGVTPTCGPKPDPVTQAWLDCYRQNKACGDDYCSGALRLYKLYNQ